ncbi:MAG: NAD(+)/NADH kinase [Ktedonobacteraceae bacterium]|nr:NAD(+)/NADH kinase [Ktedonobacteraceae bacterium]
MKTIAIFYQGRKQDTSGFAARLVPMLEKRGHHVRVVDISEECQDCTDISLQGSDLALVLGGDGTIVHAARLCACLGIPIVGINFGHVGFLTEIEPAEVNTKLDYYLNGDQSVWIDQRAMLQATLEQEGNNEEFLALNDIVIARGAWPRGVQIKVWVDNYFYNTTYADGMIISTATGSTAYNMAVGGPLLHPQVQSSVLTPIAAHLESNRSLIIPPEATIRLQLFTRLQDGVFSADGQINRLAKNGAIISVKKSPYTTRFLRRRPPTAFYQIITAKLHRDITDPGDSDDNHAT